MSAKVAVSTPGGAMPLSGPLADRPPPGVPGRFYICTDVPEAFYDTGAAWIEMSFLPLVGSGPVVVNSGVSSVEQPLALAHMSPYNLRGTLAARPAAGTAGRTYRATDVPYTYFDTGAAWVADPVVNRWFTLYDVDFTSLALSTVAGNGNFVIDGKTWTVANFANSSAMSVGGADGLRLKAAAATFNNSPPNRNGPIFQSPSLATLINGIIPDDARFGLRATAYLKAATRANTNDTNNFWIDTGSNNQRHEYDIYNATGTQSEYMRLVLNNSQKTAVTFTHLANHDVFQIEMPQFGMDVNPLRSGIYAAGWPTKMYSRGQNAAAAGQWAPCLMTAQSEAFIGFSLDTGSGAGTCEAKWGRMKVELMLYEP